MSPTQTATTALQDLRAHTARMVELLTEIRAAHQELASHRLLPDDRRAESGRIAVEAGIALGRLKAGAR